MSEPSHYHFHYRAKQCKTCRVKIGLGSCQACREFMDAMKAVVKAAAEEFAEEAKAAKERKEPS